MDASTVNEVVGLLTEIRDALVSLREDMTLREDMKRRAPGGQSSAPATTGGLTFPNYGRAKGQSVSGASRGDLDYYANGCRRTLDDPSKSKWHDKERTLLAAIEAEIDRQSGAGNRAAAGSGDAPPVFGGGDDDIPF